MGLPKGTRKNYSHLTLEELMIVVEEYYVRKGYHIALAGTLALGVAEEAGELAAAVNSRYSPDYTPRPDKDVGRIEDEIGDLLVYCLALCVKLGIHPSFRDLETS